ncbi:hypothetical protein AB0F71_33015 [Kitasatospora sp. NPDC028055]|uniref:hypothetical protein n=1 Tax=Kitasatospora sp. NPDC028055 TaxID=3155653 RepID=UPI0033CD7CA1
MSTESMPGNEDVEAAEAAVSWELGELAESVEAGPVPYDRLLAGGRRRLRRRRLLTGAAVAGLVVAVGGAGTLLGGPGTVFGGYGRGAGGASVAAVPPAAVSPGAAGAGAPGAPGAVGPGASGVSGAGSSVVTPTVTPTASVSPVASAVPSRAVRDPFTPVRVKVGEGTAKGHALEAWVALWPAAPTAEDSLRQSRLIGEERLAADPRLPPPPRQDVGPAWDPATDRADVYLVVDGKRQPGDYVDPVPAPGGVEPTGTDAVIGGVMLNRVVGTAGSPDMVVVPVRPEVARVVVGWKTGGSVEAVPVAVGDSTVRWYAVVRRPGSADNTVVSYAADGSVLRTQTTWW